MITPKCTVTGKANPEFWSNNSFYWLLVLTFLLSFDIINRGSCSYKSILKTRYKAALQSIKQQVFIHKVGFTALQQSSIKETLLFLLWAFMSSFWPTVFSQSDDNMLKNIELFDKLVSRFRHRILFLKDINGEDICVWSFYGNRRKISEICCTSIVYTTEKKQTKGQF